MKRRTGLLKIVCLVTLGVVVGGAAVWHVSGSDEAGALNYKKYQRIDFTFEPTLKLNVSGDLTIDNLSLGTNGDSNIISVETGTNVPTGMLLTATVGSSSSPYNTTGLVNGSNSFAALTGSAASLDSSDFGVNKWGYSYCVENCSTNSGVWRSGDIDSVSVTTGYAGLPLYNDVNPLKLVNTSDITDETLQFKIGAKASGAQASGEYTNVINFVAVTNVVATNYTVTFYNGAGASNWPSNVSGVVSGGLSSVSLGVLDAEDKIVAPTKEGFVFEGWCTEVTSNGDCAGNVYQANETYPITDVGATANNPLAIGLYAMWKGPSIDDIKFLQDFDGLAAGTKSAIINSMTPGQNYTRKDSRDQQDYTIAKLADGKVWMTKNLNLAGGTALSADDTDVSGSYISSFSTSNNLTKTDDTIVLPASSNSGFNSDSYSFVYNSQSETCDNNSPCYSYYSWDAATLGSGRSISTDNTDAPYSICPKGWKLPSTYNGSGTTAEATDFRALMIALGGSNSIQTYNSSTSPTGAAMYNAIKAGTAPNFLLAGYYGNGSFSNGGSYGNYWSSTSRSSSNVARNLYFDSSYVDSANSYSRRYGFSVRCLLRQ